MKERHYVKRFLARSDDKGYTFMELMMVLSIIAIVAQIGFTAWLDSKRRAYDSTAVSDTRNLVEAIVNDMVGAEDVDYTHDPEDGSRVGAYTKTEEDGGSGHEARKPSLFLSPGVQAYITGGTDLIDSTGNTNTQVYAELWHGGGTPWESASGFRTFYAQIDEDAELIEFIGLKGATSEPPP